MKQFNINDHILIKITTEGWKHIRMTCSEGYIKNCIHPACKNINGEIYHRFQLWKVFDILPLSFGKNPLFEMTILIEDIN